jgi:dipeptidyl aminopeptidase/acylaminoacyl peptidase
VVQSELKTIFFDRLREREKEFYAADTWEIKSPTSLYEAIKQRDGYLFKQEQDYSISFAINDSVKTSFFVHLPLNYNPGKSYPLLFYLLVIVQNSDLPS